MNSSTCPATLAQRQPGLVRVRFALLAGDLPASAAEALAALAEEYGRGEIRAALRHELEIPFVKETDVEALATRLEEIGLRARGVLARPNVVACPGADHCTSAFLKTKKICYQLEAFLQGAAENGHLPPDFRVAISGCPNECSHARINDMGFVGAVGSCGGRKLRGFELVVGGSVRGEGRLAEAIAFVSPQDAVHALRDMIEIYRDRSSQGQSFADFASEVGFEELSLLLQKKCCPTKAIEVEEMSLLEPTNKENMMQERTGIITFQGNPLTLVGPEIKVGDNAPDAEVLANDLSPIKLSSFAGKVVVLSCVPSLDTPVCDTQTRKFNEKAAELGDDVAILTASMDLPFAQARWCGAAGIEKVKTVSDHRSAALATAYGVLIKELRLLARAVFVIDKAGKVQYIEIVNEVTNEPDYDAALAAVKKLA